MSLPPPYDRLLVPIYLPSLLMAISNQGMILVLPLYALHVSGDPAFAALVVGLRGLGILVFDIPAGMLAARFGDKPVLLGGLLCNAIVMLALALASQPWLVAVLAIPQGAGAAAWFLGRQSYVTDSSPPHEWGRAIAVMAGINRVGAFLGPLGGGIVAEWLGYSPAFAAGAALSAVAALVALATARNVRPTLVDDAMKLSVIWRIVIDNRRMFATAGFAGLAIQLMRAARQLLVPLFGTLVGLDEAAIGLAYSLSAVLDMSLSYPAGIAMDRWGRKWTGIPCMLVFVAGLLLLPQARDFADLLVGSLVLGFANGLSTGIVMVLGMDLAPPEGRNHFLGVWRLIGDVGGVGGPLLAGVLAEAASLALASVTVAGIGVVGILIFALLVPETKPGAREGAAPRARL
jgi:MFS family permease